jgi:hypothetical protein
MSSSLFDKLASVFHKLPDSILPLILKNKMEGLPWKLTKTRLDLIRKLIDIYGISDETATKDVGWSAIVKYFSLFRS